MTTNVFSFKAKKDIHNEELRQTGAALNNLEEAIDNLKVFADLKEVSEAILVLTSLQSQLSEKFDSAL